MYINNHYAIYYFQGIADFTHLNCVCYCSETENEKTEKCIWSDIYVYIFHFTYFKVTLFHFLFHCNITLQLAWMKSAIPNLKIQYKFKFPALFYPNRGRFTVN